MWKEPDLCWIPDGDSLGYFLACMSLVTHLKMWAKHPQQGKYEDAMRLWMKA